MRLEKKTNFFLIRLAYLSFLSLGLPDGLLGTAWPSIRAYFNLSLDALGVLLVSATLLLILHKTLIAVSLKATRDARAIA